MAKLAPQHGHGLRQKLLEQNILLPAIFLLLRRLQLGLVPLPHFQQVPAAAGENVARQSAQGLPRWGMVSER